MFNAGRCILGFQVAVVAYCSRIRELKAKDKPVSSMIEEIKVAGEK
jgi:hypothetical protein